MSNIFKRLDQCDLEIKKEKRRKRYRLCVYNSLFQNGHIAEMGDPALTWLILGDKCTATATRNGKVLGYLVYSGRWSGTIINELAEIRGKSRKAIERDLKRLKKVKRIDYQKRRGVGARIVVYPIPGTFEREFKTIKDIGQNGTKQRSKRHKESVKMTLDKGQNDLNSNPPPEELAKENKGSSETGKNGSALTNTLTKTKETTTSPDVAAAISQIFKGAVKTDKVKDRIQGKNPDEVVALARYCQEESSAKNPVGLFFTMLKEGTNPPALVTKTRPAIPPPSGGYQTGDGTLCDISFYMSCVPEEAVAIAQQKFPEDVEKAIIKLLNCYHEKYDPRDYYKTEDQLTEEEKKRMVEIIKKWDKIPD